MSNEVIGCAVALALVICDVVAGYVAAIYNNEVSSSKMREGLLKKACEMFLVIVALIIGEGGVYVGLPSATCALVLGGVLSMIAVMELTSIVENICKVADLPVAKVFAMFGVDGGRDEE